MRLITLKTFDNVIDAHMLKSRLEFEGIRCFLHDEHVVGLNPLYNLTVGGIKLKISNYDVDSAMELLALNDNSETEGTVCLNCGFEGFIHGYRSLDKHAWIPQPILAIIYFFLPLYYKPVKKCKNCGSEFEYQSES